jgi:hypothetical protein
MKKNVTYYAVVAALLWAAAFTACSEKVNEGNERTGADTTIVVPGADTTIVVVDQTEFHFGSKATEQFVVSVDDVTEWEVINDASWLTTEKREDNTLLLRAEPSRLLVERTTTVTIAATRAPQVAATLTVTQDAGTPKLYVRQFASGIVARHTSADGRWVAGQRSTTSVAVEVARLVDENYVGTTVYMQDGTHSVDNNGKLYANGCSSDGSFYTDSDVIPTYTTEDGEFYPARYSPYIIRNGRKIDLPSPEDYPTANVTEPGYPTAHYYQGCLPDKMSADGKYIYGRIVATGTTWSAAKWTRIGTSSDYEFKEIGDGEYFQWSKVFTPFEGKTYMTVEVSQFLCPQNVSGLSANGKYACGHLGSSLSGGGQTFRYNMETDAIEFVGRGIALFVTDDGDLFTDGGVYEAGSTTSISLRDWVQKVYGEAVAAEVPGGWVIGGVSADKSTTVLFNASSTNTSSYIITVEP